MKITREDFENILSKLHEKTFYSVHSVVDSEELCILDENDNYLVNTIKNGRNTEKHRWYEISETILTIGEWFIGIRGPSQIYTEHTDWEDLCEICEIYEVERVEITTYDYIRK